MWTDPILEELYAIRKEIAAQFNYDVRALGEYLKECVVRSANKLN